MTIKQDDYSAAICIRNLTLLILLVVLFSVFRPVFDTQDERSNTVKILAGNRLSVTEKAQGTSVMGFDISHYQGLIDWNDIDRKVSRFVFIKATQGLSFVDSQYASNIQNSNKFGLIHGTYHFFEPQNSPKYQAENYLRVAGVKHQLPPILDIEITGGLNKNEIVKSVRDWLDIVESKTKCKPMIYTNLDFWNEYLASEFSDYALWIAEYNQHILQPVGIAKWQFWQNSDKGQVKGIQVTVDTDIFNSSQGYLKALLCK
jgi:lysozyme